MQVFEEPLLRSQVPAFAEKTIIQTKGRWAGKALMLEPWQRALLRELYLVKADRRRVYREALLGVPRKNGKSTLCAAIALHGLLATDEQSPEVYVAAASQDQARIVFNQAKDFIEASPILRDRLTPQRSVILNPANKGVFRVLSSDAPLQHGLNPSLVVIDELHAHSDPELYYALTTGQLARLDPLVVSITTAGFDRESILWQVYEYGKGLFEEGVPAMREAGFLHRWYAAADGCDHTDPEAWAQANPSSWIDPEDLARECKRLPENVFRRLHLNQWTETEEAWITPAALDDCIAQGPPIVLPSGIVVRETGFDDRKKSWGGFDLGVKRDSTAMAAVHWKTHEEDSPLIVRHKIIIPPDEGHDFGATDALEALGAFASPLGKLQEVAADPWGMYGLWEQAVERGLPMFEFNQGSSGLMGPASEAIYELINEGRLIWDGDPEMRKQMLSAVVQATERGWRISKRKSRERIDIAVAVTMAAYRAIASRIEPQYGRASW